MIDRNAIQKKYDDLINHLPEASILPQDAEILATRFLKASYDVSEMIRYLKNESLAMEVKKNILYSEAVKNAKGTTATEKKGEALADKDYLVAMFEHEEIINSCDYYKRLSDVFNNGHIFYRGLAKGAI